MTAPLQTVDYIPPSHGDSVLKALTTDFPLPQLQQPTPNGDPSATPADMSPPPAPLFPIHRYTFAGEIARGGMGAVLRGRDEDLGPEIAVKVMLDAHRGKTEYLQRFIAEARIAGQLQHPGVTPVYELGRFPDHRPYIAMKLVHGDTLAKLLKERSEPAADRNRFLKIFEQICQTLHYAHSSGVIHRDLKPQNIMVGAFGEVQVMDWGLAKALSQEEGETRRGGDKETSESIVASDGMTRAGAMLGTPAYIPPEQARGEMDRVDTRSDVFSLGAILCEILTGRLPYQGPTVPEMVAQARAGDLSAAFARLDACGADAELIALATRCLAPEPADRPRDAGVLVREFTSYLQGVEQRLRQAELTAVEAKTKAVEETKRRQVTFRLAAGILLAVLAGLAASLWQTNKAMAAEQQAKNERDEKDIAREAAQKRLAQVEKGSELLAGIFADMSDYRKRADTLEVALGTRLKEAAKLLRGDTIADPLVSSKLQHTLAGILLSFGYFAEATLLLETCSETRRTLLGADDLDTLASLQYLASAYREAGQYDRARLLLEQVHQAREAQLGPDDKDTLTTRHSLALTYGDLGQYDRSLRLLEDVHAREAEQFGIGDWRTLNTLGDLAATYRHAGHVQKSLSLLERVYAELKNSAGPTQLNTLIVLGNLAGAYREAGDPARAITLFEQVRDQMMKKLGADHPLLLTTLHELAASYRFANQPDKAIPLYEQVRDASVRKLGADHPDILPTLNDLAVAYQDKKELTKALPLFEQVCALRLQNFAPDHPDTLIALNNLANAYREYGQYDKAIPLLEQLRETKLKKLGADHPDTIITLQTLGVAYMDTERMDKAMPLFEQAAQGVEKLRFQHQYADRIIGNLLAKYDQFQQLPQAEYWRRKWLPVLKAKAGAESLPYAMETAMLGVNLFQQRKYADAEGFLHEAWGILQKKHPNDSRMFTVQAMLGAALLHQQRYSEAEPHLLQGYAGMKQRVAQMPPPIRQPRLTEALERLVQLYEATGKKDEAAKWQKELEALKTAPSPGKP
jgi:eukaryotic-like serine/threonine-protein kinase